MIFFYTSNIINLVNSNSSYAVASPWVRFLVSSKKHHFFFVRCQCQFIYQYAGLVINISSHYTTDASSALGVFVFFLFHQLIACIDETRLHLILMVTGGCFPQFYICFPRSRLAPKQSVWIREIAEVSSPSERNTLYISLFNDDTSLVYCTAT